MRTLKLLSILALGSAFSATAHAQFSVTGGGASIPASGQGGDGVWGMALPTAPGVSTVTVNEAVLNIDKVVINGLDHSWGGDVQATLADPNGVEHNLFVRPGYLSPPSANFGTPGDFLPGNYEFVQSGGASLPTIADGANIAPGVYNQTFDTGGVVWQSGSLGVLNTQLGGISGPAGTWELRIYDWGVGDDGSFQSWRLEGNGGTVPSDNTGVGYCFGDGSGATCPCSAFGAAGEGCLTTSGTGAALVATGDANIANDTFQLDITGGPANKPGLFFQGPNQLSTPVSDGILCSNSNLRYGVNGTDASGNVTQTGFGANASIGESLNYQYWFRDTGNTCGGGFNFSNGWTVTWE